MYLSIGECDGSLGPDDMYLEAMRAIFKENKPCHRCGVQPQVQAQEGHSRGHANPCAAHKRQRWNRPLNKALALPLLAQVPPAAVEQKAPGEVPMGAL